MKESMLRNSWFMNKKMRMLVENTDFPRKKNEFICKVTSHCKVKLTDVKKFEKLYKSRLHMTPILFRKITKVRSITKNVRQIVIAKDDVY